MFDYLEEMKQESERVRKSIALVTAFLLTVVVAGGWLLFASTGSFYYEGTPDAATASSTSPIASIGEAFGALTDSINDLRGSIETLEYVASQSIEETVSNTDIPEEISQEIIESVDNQE